MSIFKELRRRSKASFRTNTSGVSHSNGDMTSGQSSSTLETSYSSSTPPSSIKPTLSTSNLQTLSKSVSGSETPMQSPPPQRPVPISSQSNRNSFYAGNSSPANGSIRTPAPTSPYAPRILSVSDNSWVHQKVLLVYGQVGDPRQHPINGTLTVYHNQENFPTTTWPVCESHFKVLVHLVPGPNRLRFDFTSSKQSTSSASSHSSWHNINYLPLINSPPLDLVILLAKDSPGTFDALPDRAQRGENNLEMAVRKYRMAAYLWQAFTGEQMFRHSFGRRCFRFEEEWQAGTLSQRDAQTGQMRNEAKIHIVRSDKTVAELRDLDLAQQHGPATKKDGLFEIAKDAVTNHFQPHPDQKRYVSVLLLDSQWDTQSRVITGHAALGSDSGNIKMAIFGSHSLQSYPSCLEEVVPAFTDCTRTDTQFLANDCEEAGSNWESANIGIGAHLHEVGHLFGCPHQESGVMLRDYVRLNRTFTSREPFSTRTKSQGLKICTPADECQWHRLDALRFRFHPCFRLPSDPPSHHDESIQLWPVENGKILITAKSGVAFLEVYVDGDDLCHHFLEFIHSESPNSNVPRQVTVTEAELRQLLPSEKQKKKFRIQVFSGGLGKQTVDDVGLFTSKKSFVKLPKGQLGFKGSKLGNSQLDNTEPQQILLDSTFIQTKLLTSIKVYHGFALDGMEFFYEDATSQLFGKRGGKPGGDEFVLDTRRGEILLGFYIRAGLWIDGIEILTSLGRKSGVYGNAQGGSGHTLIPPRGYSIAGISGTCGSWVDGLSLIIMR
ncbi:putative zinc metallo proteinase [Talaromyces proteolyticus]|uniref:Zinc metallo proteinase n=1 Tax=Talaromyces proteolyticus TaxID=1131652 RepID=A0AAD4PWN6_9EURO|nr:putative zinc metallo proteinase [Talaromyces proteolyticus]KAH8692672.1 putative zinc metallo proteinase [Talaromyces proteolyticus]